MDKILLVEDDSTVLLFLKHCLDTEGCMTVTAENAKTAMSWIKETRFDLAVLDLSLPDGNGMEICAAIKENPKTHATPVIILTGNSSNDVRIQSKLDAQADLFLNKPIEPGDLRKAVKKLLGVSQAKRLLLRCR
jgi:DNA-binding response OmpR family regulator